MDVLDPHLDIGHKPVLERAQLSVSLVKLAFFL